eukprot:2469922-Prymnesium_polylepis.1
MEGVARQSRLTTSAWRVILAKSGVLAVHVTGEIGHHEAACSLAAHWLLQRVAHLKTCCTWTKNTTRHACWSAL